MAIIRRKIYVVLLVAPLVTAGLLSIYYSQKVKQLSAGATKLQMYAAENIEKLFSELRNISADTKPNLVSWNSFDSRNETFECRSASLMNMTFPICVYTADTDDTVTGLLLRGRYFEADHVTRFFRLLRLDRRLQFVDIGANVGLYTLPLAHVTQVVAVEPNWRSMSRLAKGVHLGAIGSNVTLVHNAVSNVHTTLRMGVHPTNQGNAFLINTTECKATPIGLRCNTLPATKTIFLDDLLPLMRSKAALLKADTEGHEANIFTDSSAGRFFDQIDIPLVFMEWALCKRHSADIVQRLLHFFYSRNYTAFKVDDSRLEKDYLSWPDDILFKKLS